MTPEARLIAALARAEAIAVAGLHPIATALTAAAVAHQVDRVQLAECWLTKLIARDRARLALADEAAQASELGRRRTP